MDTMPYLNQKFLILKIINYQNLRSNKPIVLMRIIIHVLKKMKKILKY